jgi:hypothetical protein
MVSILIPQEKVYGGVKWFNCVERYDNRVKSLKHQCKLANNRVKRNTKKLEKIAELSKPKKPNKLQSVVRLTRSQRQKQLRDKKLCSQKNIEKMYRKIEDDTNLAKQIARELEELQVPDLNVSFLETGIYGNNLQEIVFAEE